MSYRWCYNSLEELSDSNNVFKSTNDDSFSDVSIPTPDRSLTLSQTLPEDIFRTISFNGPLKDVASSFCSPNELLYRLERKSLSVDLLPTSSFDSSHYPCCNAKFLTLLADCDSPGNCKGSEESHLNEYKTGANSASADYSRIQFTKEYLEWDKKSSEQIYINYKSTEEEQFKKKVTTAPHSVIDKKNSKIIQQSTASDIIVEFDQLFLTAIAQICSNKKNIQIMLENLLAEEIYCGGNKSNVSDEPTVEEILVVQRSSKRQDSIKQTLKAERSPDEHFAVRTVSMQNNDWTESGPTEIAGASKSSAIPEIKVKGSTSYSKDNDETSLLITKVNPKISKRCMLSNVMEKMVKLETKRMPCLKYATMIKKPNLKKLQMQHDRNYKFADIMKEQNMRKIFNRECKFQATFENYLTKAKESSPLDYSTEIQCVSKHNFSNNTMLHCFQITETPTNGASSLEINKSVANPNSENTNALRVCHLYRVGKEAERFIWMHKLFDGTTDVLETGKFFRAGWCHLKNSITSEWSYAWILLQKQKRILICYNCADLKLEILDLRKARFLELSNSDGIIINCPPYSLYMIMITPKETKVWCDILREVAHDNGSSLEQQQLTTNNVPVLVEKCINFVYAHGSMYTGIYLKSGSVNAIEKLLQLFRTNAFDVEISRKDYNPHVVANALKRFMRDLPVRLLSKYSTSFVAVSEMNSKTEKMVAYKELLHRLPPINFHTLRKLIGHLNFIQYQQIRNQMKVENVSIKWGPTLFGNKVTDSQISSKPADVVVDLVMFYQYLFQLTPDELLKDELLQSVLQKHLAADRAITDSARNLSELKIWITLDMNPENKKEEKRQIHVTLTPVTTVYEVCKLLAPQMERQPYTVTLSEHILNGDLHRPLHHNERVRNIVLRWSHWPEADRKSNFLRLQPMKYMIEVQRALRYLPFVSTNNGLKFADCKSRSFKTCTVEMLNAWVKVMIQGERGSKKVRHIDLSTATAYLGCERKRTEFKWRWAITLIENDNNRSILRTPELPFFGHVIAGNNSADSLLWYSRILVNLHDDDILP